MIAITFTSSNIQVVNNYQPNSNLIIENSKASEILYVILVHFDFNKVGRRKQLLLEFLNHYKNLPGIRMVLVEATVDGLFDLPDKLEGVFIHHKFRIQNYIFLKENLINVAISKLPNDWQYVSWIDPHLTFLNPNWVEDTINELKISPYIQLFQTCVFMGPNGEALTIDKGVGYSDDVWAYPGYACAMTKNAFDKMGGLFEEDIILGGDSITARAFQQRLASTYLNYLNLLSPNQKEFFKSAYSYELKAKANKYFLSCINGTVIHHWHGASADRKYTERYEKILKKHIYDPKVDLVRDKDGIISLSEKGKRMDDDFKEIFCPKCVKNIF